jgi:hypothetical protein
MIEDGSAVNSATVGVGTTTGGGAVTIIGVGAVTVPRSSVMVQLVERQSRNKTRLGPTQERIRDGSF